MCHFCICADILGTKGQGAGHKVWATFLFRNLKDSLGGITGHKAIEEDEVERCIAETRDVSYTTKSNEDEFKASIIFRRFHYQIELPVSSLPLPKDDIAINVVYLIVLPA